MYKTCPDCEFLTEEVSESSCPECGTGLQFTMLPPRRKDENGDLLPEKEEPIPAPSTESLELSPAVRLAQIGTGIVIFLAVSRWGSRVLTLLIGYNAEVSTQAQAIYLFAYTGFLYVAASLAAGAVAGAWSVNWVPQGLGVGLGVLAISMLLLILFLPESMPIYLIGVLITTGLTILGAFIGHKLIRPSQFIS